MSKFGPLELYVPVKLDKPRRIKLTPDDMVEVYDTLNSQASRKTEINGITIHNALGAFDWRAWGAVLWAGLRHEDPAIEDADMGRDIITRYVGQGGDLDPVARAIRKAMMQSGAMPRKVWERIDGKYWREQEERKQLQSETSGAAEGAAAGAGPHAAPESSM